MFLTDEGIPTDSRVIYLGVYAVDRHYGGPEEGGWYYDTWQYLNRSIQTITNCEHAGDDPDIREASAKLLAEYEDDQPRYGLDSVLSDGPEIRVCVEDAPGDRHNMERQRYC